MVASESRPRARRASGDRADHGHLPGGPGRGGPFAVARINPKDSEQLAEHPVSLRRIGGLFRRHRLSLGVVIGLIVASSAVGLATPFLTKAIIDDAIGNQDVSLLLMLVGGLIAVAAITSILGVIQTWLATTVGQRVMHRLRTDVFTHLQRQSVDFFTRTRGGEVQARLTQDIQGMQSVVTSTATSIAANITTAVGTVIAMLALSWQLSLLSLIVLPPAIWLTRKVAGMRREVTAARQRAMADLQSHVDESLSVSAVLLSKVLGTGPAAADFFERTSTELMDLEVRAQLAGRWRMAWMSILFAAIPALVYLIAGLPATSAGMTIGTLVAFTGLQAALFRPLMGVLNVGVEVVSSMALFSRVFEYLDLPVELHDPDDPVRLDTESVRGQVRFDDVAFTYAGAGAPALAAIDLEVPAGSSLALVGHTGSGKTTLGSLVARLADPTRGRISIDGVDLRDMAMSDLARVVGVVSQETYLLHTTVRENLRYARPEATDSEIETAARAAQVHELIAALPQGYDTLVGARGHRFSGGEKQRIAIARTILRDPKVLVLDEATSALDNTTERAVQQALDALSVGRTTITIAHRLSTVAEADQIVVLEHGRIAERGTHVELLAAGGGYAALAGRGELLTTG
ncbi:MAG: ABC transporter ATP-binding protein [Beutenbergiaceae bacterium]